MTACEHKWQSWARVWQCCLCKVSSRHVQPALAQAHRLIDESKVDLSKKIQALAHLRQHLPPSKFQLSLNDKKQSEQCFYGTPLQSASRTIPIRKLEQRCQNGLGRLACREHEALQVSPLYGTMETHEQEWVRPTAWLDLLGPLRARMVYTCFHCRLLFKKLPMSTGQGSSRLVQYAACSSFAQRTRSSHIQRKDGERPWQGVHRSTVNGQKIGSPDNKPCKRSRRR